MKPVYWVPLLALLGAIIGYALFHATGWFGTTAGLVAGVLMGALVYRRMSSGSGSAR